MQTDLSCQPELEEKCEYLRRNLTLAEIRLWEVLSDRQLDVEFCCKVGISQFIVDFYSAEIKFAIQCDRQFVGIDTSDLDQYLDSCGIAIVHISSIDVRKNFEELINNLVWDIHVQRVNLGIDH